MRGILVQLDRVLSSLEVKVIGRTLQSREETGDQQLLGWPTVA